jgi:2-keto-3-deoxy-L-rhamnonate aldolase RhmA
VPHRAANPLVEKFNADERAYGTFLFSPDPANSEIAGHAGLDFVIVDMEHAPLALPDALAHIRAANAARISPVVRVGQLHPQPISQLIDSGAQGIMLPHTGLDMAETSRALDAMRYAPTGFRGTCRGVRGAAYGFEPFDEYFVRSDRDVMSFGLIEDASVCERIDELLDSVRLDAVVPGRADIATSLGLHGQPDDPTVVEMAREVLRAAKARGVKTGMVVLTAAAAEAYADLELDFLVVSTDQVMLANGYRDALATIREHVPA